MTEPDTAAADYSLRPIELAERLTLLVEARQPAIVWGAPGCAKSQIAQKVADDAGREYIDVRALLLAPVDLRGIPWRDSADRTRWAPPAFLAPSDMDGRWLINLEELPSAVPMVQAALYQLVLDRRCGEYELPGGAALIACGNREASGGIHRMPMPLTGAPETASRPRCSSSSRCAQSCCTPSTPNRRRRPSPFRGSGSLSQISRTAGTALTRPVSAPVEHGALFAGGQASPVIPPLKCSLHRRCKRHFRGVFPLVFPQDSASK